MKITKIIKKTGNKYEIIIDDKKHIIYDDVLLKYNLLKPCDITNDRYNDLLNDNNEILFYNKIISFISFKMRSRKEVKDKLILLGASEVNINHIIYRLENEGYINNEKYINAFIKDQLNLTLYGPDKIISNLVKKGFSLDNARKYVQNIPYDVWKERCNKIIDKKVKSLKNGSKRAVIGKIRNNLISYGYNEDYYRDYLGKISINEDEFIKKGYDKIKKKLEKEYTGDELEFKIKQKLFAKGYNISKLNM